MKPILILTLIVISVALQVKCFYTKSEDFKPLIIEGQNATRRQFPHIVSLHKYGSHSCGGAIISPKWVVTAAHCFSASNDMVAISGLLDQGEYHPDNQIIPVIEVVRHPKYDENDNKNDIAMIGLEFGFIFNEAVQPVRLPQPGETFNGRVTVSGWGRIGMIPSKYPTRLQYLEMPIISNDECDTRLELLGGYPYGIADHHICTLPESAKQSACYADSGSPLLKDGNILVGVVNGGDTLCSHNLNEASPNVFARVSSFMDFIQENRDRSQL